MRFMPFHHTLMQMEGNYDNATLLTIVEVELDLCHSTTHWHKWKVTVAMPFSWIPKQKVNDVFTIECAIF